MKLLEQSTTAVNALAEAHAKLHILAEEQEVAAQRHSDLAQEYAMLEARYAEVQGPQQAAGLADRGWSITRQKNANCASQTASVMHSGNATKRKVCDACFSNLHKTKGSDSSLIEYKSLYEVQAREHRATDERHAKMIAHHEAALATQQEDAQKRLDTLRAEHSAELERMHDKKITLT